MRCSGDRWDKEEAQNLYEKFPNCLIIKKCIVGTLHSISSITEIKDFLSHLFRSVSLAAALINFLRRRLLWVIRNPLRYLLINSSRFQRHLSRDYDPC